MPQRPCYLDPPAGPSIAEHFPVGLVGLVMVGIFAAAMSSIDSALNSLSAATIEDLVDRRGTLPEHRLFVASKLATLGWGAFAVIFSYQVERIAPTVLEAINKISSMVNGPLLALFVIALLAPKQARSSGADAVGYQNRALIGFAAGILANVGLGVFAPEVSWLWWNVAGFAVALVVAGLPAAVRRDGIPRPPRSHTWALLGMGVLILAVCAGFQRL